MISGFGKPGTRVYPDLILRWEDDYLKSNAMRPLSFLLLLLALARLGFFAATFARESLQMDFAAYYTAGEALNRGLDPYVNHVDATPPLWDGVARYTHSRFLYPPLAAYLFRPLAALPYGTAKTIWTALGILTTAASLVTAAWIIGIKWITRAGWLWIAIAAATFHPLLTHLERGQIDTLTLLLLMGSIGLMVRAQRSLATPDSSADLDTPRRALKAAPIVAGFLLALASLLKLHIGLILPFLVIRKRWGVVAAYTAGLALIGITSLLVAPDLNRAYIADHLPRISVFGEAGTAEMLVPQERLDALLAGVPEGMTLKGFPGQTVVYERESFGFFANGTLVRYVEPRLAQSTIVQRLGVQPSVSQLSLGLFALLFGAFYLCQHLYFRTTGPEGADPIAEFVYWNLALVVIAITAPQTWVMNLVWLLPLFVVLAAELQRITAPGAGGGHLPEFAIAMVVLMALALAGIPDRFIAAPYIPLLRWAPERWLYPLGWEWASHKYLVAQGLLLAAGVASTVVLVARKRRRSVPRQAGSGSIQSFVHPHE